MTPSRYLLVIPLVLATLTACSDVRESLGLGRSPPDEFAVIDRPPLSMPPDFGLRPPKPGAPRLQQVDITQRASDALFSNDEANGQKASATLEAPSDAEKALLEQSNASRAEPNIRTIVDRETSQKVVESPHLVDELLWWKKDKDNTTTVDAAAEAARIKDAQDKGVPYNASPTPIIEREKSGWLGL